MSEKFNQRVADMVNDFVEQSHYVFKFFFAKGKERIVFHICINKGKEKDTCYIYKKEAEGSVHDSFINWVKSLNANNKATLLETSPPRDSEIIKAGEVDDTFSLNKLKLVCINTALQENIPSDNEDDEDDDDDEDYDDDDDSDDYDDSDDESIEESPQKKRRKTSSNEQDEANNKKTKRKFQMASDDDDDQKKNGNSFGVFDLDKD